MLLPPPSKFKIYNTTVGISIFTRYVSLGDLNFFVYSLCPLLDFFFFANKSVIYICTLTSNHIDVKILYFCYTRCNSLNQGRGIRF